MSGKRDTVIRWLSLLAGFIIGLQIFFIFLNGEPICLNEGCRVVEKLTVVPPLYIDFAGLLYFIVLFLSTFRSGVRPLNQADTPRLLLLLGLAAEGVLLSYQIFVIGTYCLYCLVIFSIIVLLNLLCGWRQIRFGIPLFGVVLAAFAVLNFSPATLLALRSGNLDSGTLAVKKCDAPARKLYFFFSSDCPHCKKVLSVLENCNGCEFHFNPIDTMRTLPFPDLEYTSTYTPALNRVILTMLNISTIPVLLVQNHDGFVFIKGEGAITDYISRECSLPVLGISPDPAPGDDLNDMNILDEQEGECSIEVECPEEAGDQQSLLPR